MKEKLKAKVKEIKDAMPKEKWAEAIKAARAELAEPEVVEISNVPYVTGDSLATAEGIMKDDENIIIRYLRKQPTVGVAVKEEVKQRVICAGVPFGVMVAFMHNDQLYVGWSRRHSGKNLQKERLEKLFRGTITMMQDTRMVQKVSENQAGQNYEALLAEFAKTVRGFTKGDFLNDVEEVPFCKRKGKIAAIGRALKDTIMFEGKYIISAFSGPLPKEVAKNLPGFIRYAEEKFGTKASNVATDTEDTKDLVVSVGTAVATT